MSRVEPGKRVMAIRSADDQKAYSFGEGTYMGEEVPPPDVIGPFGPLHDEGITNPKIVLDNGEVVWGCECWFAAVETVRKMIGSRPVELVTVADYRRESSEQWASRVARWKEQEACQEEK